MPEEKALAIARDKYVDVDIHKSEFKDKLNTLASLPGSCYESALCLEKARDIFEDRGVFTKRMIDGIITSLCSFEDSDLRERAEKDPDLMKKLVEEYFYCG